LPPWLAPISVKIVPVMEDQLPYAEKVLEKIKVLGMRAELDRSSDKLGAKIRNAQLEKVPFAVVIGKREVDEEKLSIRKRGGEDLGSMDLSEALKMLEKESARPMVGKAQ